MSGLPTLRELQTALPPELSTLPQWLPWTPRPRPGGGIGKVPCLPRGGRLYPADCRQAGLPMEEAHALAVQFGASGLGVVLPPDARLSVLDLDGPLDVDARALFHAVAGYAETSPSGRGLHVWLTGHLSRNRRGRWGELLGNGFVTVTAQPIPGRPRRLGALQDVLTRLDGHRDEGCGDQGRGARPTPELSLCDAEVLTRLFGARNGPQARRLFDGDLGGYRSPSEADWALARQLRFYTQDGAQVERLMRTSGLARPKWGPEGVSGTYLDRTIRRALAAGGPTYVPRRTT